MHLSKPILALFGILIAVMLVGEVMVYVSNPYEYNSELNGNEVTVGSSVSGDFRAVQFSSPSDVEEIVIFHDRSYQSVNGVSESDATELVKELRIRGRTARIADAMEIKNAILNTDPTKTMLVFPDGSLPDTIYSCNPADPLVTWFCNGGHVSWLGAPIGKYICTTTEIITIGTERYGLFFSEGTLREGPDKCIAENPVSPLGKALCLRYSNCTYGVSASCLDTLPLRFVSEEGFCSIALTKLYNGDIIIFGGAFDDCSRTDLAQILAAGLTTDSMFIYQTDIHVTGNTEKGNVNNIPGSGVYVFCGMDYTCYGRPYRL